MPNNRQSRCLFLEVLEDRLAPAIFNLVPEAADGLTGSLRWAISQANSNGDASNTINLAAGTYSLTDTTAGNLLIANANGNVPIKTLTIAGQGQVIIEPDAPGWNDRIFQIEGPFTILDPGITDAYGMVVNLEGLTIQDGKVSSSGGIPLTEANGNAILEGLGGGILVQNAQVTLDNVVVQNNVVQGLPGPAGSNGTPDPDGTGAENGGDGDWAAGGGIYVEASHLTLVNSLITGNTAVGGDGGNGGNGTAPVYGYGGGYGAPGGAAVMGPVVALLGRIAN